MHIENCGKFFFVLKNSTRSKFNFYHTDKTFGYKFKPVKQYEVPTKVLENRNKESNFYRLVTAYRENAHLVANINPINLDRNTPRVLQELDPKTYGLKKEDEVNFVDIIHHDKPKGTVSEALEFLNKVYCGNISAQFSYLEEIEKEWFSKEFEKTTQDIVTEKEKVALAKTLLRSEVFDNFLAKKFTTVKRYGCEGAEGMMAFFQEFVKLCAYDSVDTVVVGMPHRGRLNLLTGLLNLPPVKLFTKLKGHPDFPTKYECSGDVISHLISTTELNIDDKKLNVTVLYNPSHLEAVNPVSMGKTRAKQLSHGDGDYSENETSRWSDKILNLQIHGDAALAGQGVNYEMLNFTAVPHFEVGGSIHFVVNNQLGFTTPGDRGRSAEYCTDLAKIVLAPVLHVNGDTPEAILKATRVAFKYQREFRKDVFIDLNCYRQWGHNELDDPTFTNPTLYKIIRSKRTVPQRYSDDLITQNLITEGQVHSIRSQHESWLNSNLSQVESYKPQVEYPFRLDKIILLLIWSRIQPTSKKRLQADTTHSDLETEMMSRKTIANSILSEEAVLAFEYGMSVENPNNLIMWEAQFGDFFNGAQSIFDTFVASGEAKWLWSSGLVILLPHGYDGTGPDHSSCRLERFLQQTSSKEDKVDGDNVNVEVCQPSTSAQYFHLLRRQMVRNYRKPLVVVMPKSLLRNTDSASNYTDIIKGTSFEPVIGDPLANPLNVEKVIFTSGKHYYTLLNEQKALQIKNTAIIRVESFCPFPTMKLQKEIDKYTNARIFLWCQEEPQNMGAWSFIKPRFENLLGKRLRYVGRETSASPAVGVAKWHQEEVDYITKEPFRITLTTLTTGK
ncbi:probable 2-oxoglutarate dehydrogenase E1 component DHKTD1 homolog, mitochondrial [Agrilus planipennis]|uniref:Probable 2-oxoglutarate dehydrogenase E1 component DHKTD1 homolog, mitochondrial n=1 Tax=Agrilus planipennis TaxID=224129 RepID=A0A7F5RBR8_AGRPL|nr:probable 2-oxoglutarate dehydrogenase E1 component DHKTD1 homolog, mitochondrial [Agrilus planipennis]